MRNTEGTSRPRKRSRTSDDADDTTVVTGGKKTRGRPRVDTQDATAADRRRTQIRLAQRAYRQRKETTISSLKQRNFQLHALVDQMNKTFVQFNDAATQSGLLRLNLDLAKEFKQLHETFRTCIKSANEQVLDSDEEEFGETSLSQETRDPAAPIAVTQPQSSKVITSPQKEQSWGHIVTTNATEHHPTSVDVPQPQSYLSHISSSSYSLPESGHQSSVVHRRQITESEPLLHSSLTTASYQPEATDNHSQTQQQRQPLPFGLVDLPSREQSPFVPPYIFPIHVPARGAELPPRSLEPFKVTSHHSAPSMITRSLSPTYTYSYEEVTFARRLTRATLEAGYMLLNTSSAPSALLTSKFKLSLPYLTLDELRARFKLILARGVNEDLDWYATPFLHLGGAGTHYQRRDAYGKAMPMKNTWTVRQIGPLDRRMIRLENVANGQIQDLEGLDLDEFDGEWFDAYDVQGYLEEQWHCKIDPKSSFAECLIEDEMAASDKEIESPSLRSSSTTETTEYAVTPPTLQPFNVFEPSYSLDLSFNNGSQLNFYPGPPKDSVPDLSFDETLGLDLAPGFGMGFAGSNGYSTFGLNLAGETEQLPVVQHKSKRIAWVDVSKLIDKVIKQAVCLGRAPGYRRKDIDMALREALVPAF